MSQNDGSYYLQLAHVQQQKLSELVQLSEEYLRMDALPTEDLKGAMRAMIGKARLLISEKFKQFKSLCQINLTPREGEPEVHPTDLEGFWDLIMIEVMSIVRDFNDITEPAKRNTGNNGTSSSGS